MPEQESIPVAALLNHNGAHAPAKPATAIPPLASPGLIAVRVTAGVGDYRSGEEIWCERLMPAAVSGALNRDVPLPRPAGRFLFSRLLRREDSQLHRFPLGPGMREQVIADPAGRGDDGNKARTNYGEG